MATTSSAYLPESRISGRRRPKARSRHSPRDRTALCDSHRRRQSRRSATCSDRSRSHGRPTIARLPEPRTSTLLRCTISKANPLATHVPRYPSQKNIASAGCACSGLKGKSPQGASRNFAAAREPLQQERRRPDIRFVAFFGRIRPLDTEPLQAASVFGLSHG